MRWQRPPKRVRVAERFRYPQRNLQLRIIRMVIGKGIAKWALLPWRTRLTGPRRKKRSRLGNLIIEKVGGIVLDSVGKGF